MKWPPEIGDWCCDRETDMEGRVIEVEEPPIGSKGRGWDVKVEWDDGTVIWRFAEDLDFEEVE